MMTEFTPTARPSDDYFEPDLDDRRYLEELRRSVRAARRVLADTGEQGALFTVFRNFPVFDLMRVTLKRLPILQDPEFRRLYEAGEMPDLTAARVRRLAELPEGTLGGAFGRYCVGRGLSDAHLLYVMAPTNPQRYLIYRTTMLHDILHFVTGYDPSGVVGEMEIDAFQMVQTGAPNHALFLMGGLGNTFLSHGYLPPEVLRRIAQARRRGRSAANLFLTDWDALLERPLEEVLVALRLA